jgi:NADH dehydrogenase
MGGFFLGRDIVSLSAVQTPRAVFEEFAARPKPPAADAAPAVEAPKKAPAKKAPAKKEPVEVTAK